MLKTLPIYVILAHTLSTKCDNFFSSRTTVLPLKTSCRPKLQYPLALAQRDSKGTNLRNLHADIRQWTKRPDANGSTGSMPKTETHRIRTRKKRPVASISRARLMRSNVGCRRSMQTLMPREEHLSSAISGECDARSKSISPLPFTMRMVFVKRSSTIVFVTRSFHFSEEIAGFPPNGCVKALVLRTTQTGLGVEAEHALADHRD